MTALTSSDTSRLLKHHKYTLGPSYAFNLLLITFTYKTGTFLINNANFSNALLCISKKSKHSQRLCVWYKHLLPRDIGKSSASPVWISLSEERQFGYTDMINHTCKGLSEYVRNTALKTEDTEDRTPIPVLQSSPNGASVALDTNK